MLAWVGSAPRYNAPRFCTPMFPDCVRWMVALPSHLHRFDRRTHRAWSKYWCLARAGNQGPALVQRRTCSNKEFINSDRVARRLPQSHLFNMILEGARGRRAACSGLPPARLLVAAGARAAFGNHHQRGVRSVLAVWPTPAESPWHRRPSHRLRIRQVARSSQQGGACAWAGDTDL
jgi:hypothetical protein